jgi:hypothetical protein
VVVGLLSTPATKRPPGSARKLQPGLAAVLSLPLSLLKSGSDAVPRVVSVTSKEINKMAAKYIFCGLRPIDVRDLLCFRNSSLSSYLYYQLMQIHTCIFLCFFVTVSFLPRK